LPPRHVTLTALAIVCLAGVLRLIWLTSVPNGLFCDEASTGYDAFSLLHTGRDQYGEFMPLFARSVGDYNESLYRFLSVPFVALFGLEVFAVRLPAAIAGIATVAALYALGRRWFDSTTGLVAAALLAVSPWHLALSRVAFRSILLPLFFCLALICFDRGLKQKSSWLLWSGACFGLSLFTYSAARVFVPAFVLVLVVLRHQELRAKWRETTGFLLIIAAFLVVMAPFWLSDAGLARASFAVEANLATVVSNYFSYFSPEFLFFNGDPNLRHSPFGFGELHLLEIATVISGLFLVLRRRGENDLLVLSWLVLFPVPAFLSAPDHALRSLVGVPVLALLSAHGAVELCRILPEGTRRKIAAGTIGILLCASAGRFLHHYYVEYPRYSARHWQYGAKEAYAAAGASGAPCVVISSNAFLPHFFYLFYNRIPPAIYQSHPVPGLSQTQLGIRNYSLGNFHIAPLGEAIQQMPRCVFIAVRGDMQGMRPHYEVLREIRSPLGEVLYRVFRRASSGAQEGY